MIKLLHTADIHLDAPFPSLGEREADRRTDFLKTFERLLTLAIKNEVHFFLVAGDLFDHPRPDAALVGKVQAGLKRLADRGILPVLLPGTHDNVIAADSVYRRVDFPGVLLLDAPTVEEPALLAVQGEQVYFYGFAYRAAASAQALESMSRRSSDGIHIGLLHGSRQGSPEWDYRKKDLPFTLPLLKSWNLDYVALGHYHSFEVLEDGGRPIACYPGSPEGKRFGDNGPRHCALVTLEPGKTRVEKIVVNSRILEEKELDLSGCADEEEAAEAITRLGRPDLLLRLSLTGIVEAPLDLGALRARCADSFFHLEVQDRTRLFDSSFAQRIAGEETVRGLFVRRIRQMIENAGPEERQTLEEALREVMTRFHVFGGGGS